MVRGPAEFTSVLHAVYVSRAPVPNGD